MNNLTAFGPGFRIFFNSGAGAFTLSGNGINFFDFGGNNPLIENDSSNLQTITFQTDVEHAMDFFANTGNLAFTSNGIYIDSSATLNITAASGKSVLVADTINNGGGSTGNVVVGSMTGGATGSGTVIFSGNNTYTGSTTLNAGTLQFGDGTSTNGSVASTTIFANGTSTVSINKTTGGVMATPVGSNPGASTTLLGTNAAGTTNSFSGTSFSNGGTLTVTSQNAGANLAFTNSSAIDIKSTVFTVNGSGTTTFSGALYTSNAAGGSLIKDGSGTLLLQNTADNYTGTDNTQLNASGTQLKAGTLGISGALALGLAPAGTYNNIQFIGNSTLQDTTTNITLGTTRNISVANGVTATFDSNGNTFTIQGIINGTGGSVTKAGAGTLNLSGSNTYAGVTTVNAGTLNLTNAGTVGGANGGTLANTSRVTVNTGGTLLLSASNAIGTSAAVTLAGGTFNANSFSEGKSNGSSAPTTGVGALTLSGNSTLDFGSGSTAGTLAFSDSHTLTWSGTLTIMDWNGTPGTPDSPLGKDALFFGTSASALTSTQLGEIQFNIGGKLYGAQIAANGEVFSQVPEPTTVFGGLALLGLIGCRERRRLSGLLKKA